MFPRKVIMIGAFPPPVTGESFINRIVRDIILEKNVHVDVINTSLKDGNTESPGNFSIRKFFKSIKLYLSVFSIKNYDVVYLTPGQTPLGLLRFVPYLCVSKIFRKKVIIHFHGSLAPISLAKLPNPIINLYRESNLIVILSDILRESFEIFFDREKLKIIHNFSPIDTIDKSKIKVITSCLKVVFLSNIIREKGIYETISAVSSIGSGVELIIAGSLPENEKKEFEKIIKDKNNINYIGSVYNDEKYDLLKDADVFCLPSYYKIEGVPVSMLEAMACGCAVITCDTGAILDLINENGCVVAPGNPENITECLNYYLENPDILKQHKENSINLVDDKYNRSTFNEQITQAILGEIR